ncbi:hypothetical protein SS1G_12518 [Sclerotinia sclerotiorum 1980 UF-70]|uniref:Uncharacterized protein n=1 Tax=Sclerotinia sclerotiorum (strain ATCC 18683 / 1980 / Ss-1) TaxID=665079 RepID=A7F4J3_SCLS1|nr:hypothetical protein SS1G_12518 [Sclerotinia sclerotiorum 1980 UF-70]EDN97664.1 hypothetical protein SS1G_12518 [Sclerotinia sclerotiorum 1980 UF-70]
MASTYYYYYEIDDGIEVHDTAIPFTTTCPYMPGQPVNILWVQSKFQHQDFEVGPWIL